MFKLKKRKPLGKIIVLFSLLFLVAALSGCAAASMPVSTPKAAMDGATSAPAPAMPQEPALGGGHDASYSANSVAYNAERGFALGELESRPSQGTTRRFVIQNASLTLEIVDIEEVAESIKAGVEQLGGYIASLNFYDLTRERRFGHISLRVPEDKYAQAMLMLQEHGDIKNIEESARDVTTEYIDLEARIENLSAQEKRIRELLEKAGDIEDILQIEKELTRIRGDLESMQGEFKYLQERVNFSSINVTLEEKDPRAYAVVDEFNTFGEELAERFSLNTNRLIKGLTGLLLSFLGALPIILPLALLGLILWRIVVFLQVKKVKKLRKEDRDLSS